MILAHINVTSVFIGLGIALSKLAKLQATAQCGSHNQDLPINGRKHGIFTCHEQNLHKLRQRLPLIVLQST